MRQLVKNICIVISSFIFISLTINLHSQVLSKNINTEIIQERIVLITDRTIYAVNENIYFKAYYQTNQTLSKPWSTVLYIELIQINGDPVLQLKYPLNIKGRSGTIRIPKNILTGNYYLKAYTKWMRNYPTNTYAYHKLTLINPFDASINSNIRSNKNNLTNTNISNNELDIEIKTNKNSYNTREKVSVSIKPNKYNLKENEYCISVVKKGALNTTQYSSSNFNFKDPEYESAKYYPEINGIIISGKVLNKKNKLPEDKVTLNLGYINKHSNFLGFKSNENGEFFFNFPYMQGKKEFFINASKKDIELDIEIDNEFCSRPVKLNTTKFKLTEKEKIIGNEISINAQIKKAFRNAPKDTILNKDKRYFSFYGAPDKIYYTKDYINLPNIEEFIFEIIENIKIKYKKQKPLIINEKRHTLSSYPFLIMVDNLPVTDLPAFLKIESDKIERFEVIDNGYIIANLKYSGILNLITKAKNLAGIDLPPNSMFFRYQMYYKQEEKKFPQTKSKKISSRIPDRRNCLYWNPNYKMNKKGDNDLTFQTTDLKGEYEIIVQSISKNEGEVLISRKSFMVK